MGNTQSSSRERYTGLANESTSALNNDSTMTTTSSAAPSGLPDSLPQPSSLPNNDSGSRLRGNIYASLRRRMTTSAVSRPSAVTQNRLSEGDGEQEDRPLVHEAMDTINESEDITTTPSPNLLSSSRSSRLGSRFLPDSVARILLSSGEETADEGRALRNGAADRVRNSASPRAIPGSSNRFSITGSLRRRLDHRPEARTDTRRHTIRGPFPLDATHQLLAGDVGQMTQYDGHSSLHSNQSQLELGSVRRSSRLRRVRNSLSTPFQGFMSRSHRGQAPYIDLTDPNDHARPAVNDSTHLLPSLTSIDTRVESEDAPHELDAVEQEARNMSSLPSTTSMGGTRRFTHGLRTRSTRLLRRTENPPLSQVLELAAAAIAAQLSGHNNSPLRGGRPFSGDAFDGSIQSFVHTLQEAASAQAGNNVDMNASDGDLPPVNFMRVFQFPNDENGSPIPSPEQSTDLATNELDQLSLPADNDRSVTLVLVGVRSMPHELEGNTAESRPSSSNVDNLLSIPFFTPTNLLSRGASGAFFRRSDGRHRNNSRRHSMTNFRFPAQYESQRHHATRPPTTGGLLEASHGSTVTPLSESPPGPHPPPSTPADIRSGHATPVRRPSSASAIHAAVLPDLVEDNVPEVADPAPDTSHNLGRQRRRSDSEFARRPELSSGASRRNGMVEPDPISPSIGRSWLIYVVGTNVSSDHPAFTMPSLFTENPSYEDMQMLSTLLGPVKPPVATEEDVSASGGLFRVVLKDVSLVIESEGDESSQRITLRGGERCLICLSDYEVEEKVRMLHKCQHVYHRECIDEWLTTGRNSCPMCRGEGVSTATTASSHRGDPVLTGS